MADHSHPERVYRGGVWDRSNLEPDTGHIKNRRLRDTAIVRILDDIGFNWPVFIAVSAGFLASSYTIFSSNIIGPALQYVYPTGLRDFGEPGLTIDMVTIGTTTLGMLICGHLADRLGRKKLYGLELFIIIIGTAGMVQSSDGYVGEDGRHSLDIYAAVASWRGIQGLGIGAEYPLSGIIAAEFSSTQTRGTLMASMFAMQSLGRVLAYVVALGTLNPLPDNESDHRVSIDRMWRLVVGISAIPALLAIGLRLTIPETPRYYSGIAKDLTKAMHAAERVGGKPKPADLESIHSDVRPTTRHRTTDDDDDGAPWLTSAWDYLFRTEKGWKRLFGISSLWFLLDMAFYGLGLDSPATLHRLWLDREPQHSMTCKNVSTIVISATEPVMTTLSIGGAAISTVTELLQTATNLEITPTTITTTIISTATSLPDWNQDDGDLCADIRDSLRTTAVRTLLLSSIASVLGSVAAIIVINRFSRRGLLTSTSGILCALFFAAGFSVWQATEKPINEVSMVFFALTQFMFNLGPNTLIFVMAAESFPTVFRGTMMGVAAATGKLGALVIRPVMHTVGSGKASLRNVLFGFSGVMLLMVAVSLVPEATVAAQKPRRKKTLEEMERASWFSLLWPEMLVNKSLEEIAPNPQSIIGSNTTGFERQEGIQMQRRNIGKTGDGPLPAEIIV